MNFRKKLYFSVFGTIDTVRRNYNYRKEIKLAHNRLENFPQPKLTSSEIKEINDFWQQFGIRFKDYSWFQLYYGMTGIHSPKFIPQELYFYSILPYYNNQRVRDAYKDKNAFDLILPTHFFPATIIKRIGGYFYDKNGNYITDNPNDKALIDFLLDEKEVVVKNAMDSGRGENVRKYSIQSTQDVIKILNTWTVKDYIVQKVIKQHPFFAQFNESSVNIIRVNTWYHEGKVEISTPVLRFGMPGYSTDCCFIDGVEVVHLAGITEDGYLRDKIVDLRGEVTELSTYITSNNDRVPAWDKIKEMVTEGASKLKHFRLVGWDITVTEEGEPKVIEYNILAPSTYSSQATDGPMWGDYTEALLAFLKDKKNQDIYIPKMYRGK